MPDAPTTLRLRPGGLDEEIAVETWAGAAPALVFLHGMTSTRTGRKSAALLARARGRGLRFARFDFRSALPDNPFGYHFDLSLGASL